MHIAAGDLPREFHAGRLRIPRQRQRDVLVHERFAARHVGMGEGESDAAPIQICVGHRVGELRRGGFAGLNLPHHLLSVGLRQQYGHVVGVRIAVVLDAEGECRVLRQHHVIGIARQGDAQVIVRLLAKPRRAEKKQQAQERQPIEALPAAHSAPTSKQVPIHTKLFYFKIRRMSRKVPIYNTSIAKNTNWGGEKSKTGADARKKTVEDGNDGHRASV